eukprot:6194940-Pleurochrysis_carterae.AAC.2
MGGRSKWASRGGGASGRDTWYSIETAGVHSQANRSSDSPPPPAAARTLVRSREADERPQSGAAAASAVTARPAAARAPHSFCASLVKPGEAATDAVMEVATRGRTTRKPSATRTAMRSASETAVPRSYWCTRSRWRTSLLLVSWGLTSG